MRFKEVAPWVFAGGVAIYLARTIARLKATKSLDFSIKNIKPSISGLSLNLAIDVLISNPSSQSVTLNSLSGDISMNDNYMGHVTTNSIITVLPAQQSVYTLNVSIGLLGLGLQLAALIQGKTVGPVSVKFDGVAVIEDLNFPVTLIYKIV